MEEKIEAPVLTAEQKLKILLVHREYIKAQNWFNNAQRELNAVADGLVKEVGIDGTKFSFNLDTLLFEPK